MDSDNTHTTHADIIKRLNRASGHLKSVTQMIQDGRPCLDIAQQMHAVEKAIQQAKRILVHDHIDHCLEAALDDDSPHQALDDFKSITRYL